MSCASAMGCPAMPDVAGGSSDRRAPHRTIVGAPGRFRRDVATAVRRARRPRGSVCKWARSRSGSRSHRSSRAHARRRRRGSECGEKDGRSRARGPSSRYCEWSARPRWSCGGADWIRTPDSGGHLSSISVGLPTGRGTPALRYALGTRSPTEGAPMSCPRGDCRSLAISNRFR